MVIRTLSVVLALGLVGGCANYSSNREQCSTLADCNPGKDCGLLVKCSDGECDPKQKVELPCRQGCQSNQDCPEGMHCRTADDSNVCVADGSCIAVSECQGLPHDSCLGEFVCSQGTCRYQCQDITKCTQDSDCTLVWQGCCGASGLDDYTSINSNAVSQWQGREECQLVDCMPCEYCPFAQPSVCWEDGCLESFCQDGHCSQRRRDPRACSEDADCVKAEVDCCDCKNGGLEGALNAEMVDAYGKYLDFLCATVGACWPAYNCTDRKPVCREGLCTLPEESPCDCPDLWDPVCVALPNDTLVTYPNACEAECDGYTAPWYYHGKCDCMMDCDGDPCDNIVCAENGATYYCGRAEAECNGVMVRYRGTCSAECEDCLMLDRPPIPACDENFCDQGDICFASCHGLDWWHTGACLTGEGSSCGGIAGLECPGAELFCLVDSNYPDAAGTCIKLGSCREDAHCENQPLGTCPDGSRRTCQEHVCSCT